MNLEIDKNFHKVFLDEVHTQEVFFQSKPCLYRICLVMIDDKPSDYLMCDISSKDNSIAIGKLVHNNRSVQEFTNKIEFNNIVFDLMKGKVL